MNPVSDKSKLQYVYVLRSKKSKSWCTGYTSGLPRPFNPAIDGWVNARCSWYRVDKSDLQDLMPCGVGRLGLQQRFKEHQNGKFEAWTKGRGPFKTSPEKRYLRERLKRFLSLTG